MIDWSVICVFLGLAFLSEFMGLFAHEFNAAAGIVLLLAGLLVVPSRIAFTGPPDGRTFRRGIAVAVLGVVLLPVQLPLRPFAAALALWGAYTAGRGRGNVRPAQAALAVGAVLFGIYQYLYGNSLLSWYAVQHASAGASWLTESIARMSGLAVGEFVVGPTFSALGTVVLALAVLAASACGTGFPAGQDRLKSLSHERPPWRRAGAAIVAVVLISVIYLCVLARTQPDPTAPMRETLNWWQRVQHALNPVYMPGVLACVLSVPVAIALSRRGAGEQAVRVAAPPGGSPLLLPAVLAAGVFGVAALCNLPGEQRLGKGTGGKLRFALYKEGFLNWMTPDKQRYGSRSGGMFGNLPVMLRCMGWEGDIVNTLDQDTLDRADVLFLANPKDSLPEETIRRIERFVLDGGALLALGDHTWRKDDAPGMILDEPLGPASIRYRFDSAYYFIGGWLHSMQYWPHPTTVHLRDETNESGCVVGASLEIAYPAAPLVIGRYGYADKGHDEKHPQRGYMDNGLPDPGERLGDLVLVAAENVGRGRVVVAGDTSGFVNAIQTQTWRFTSRVFNWLGSSGRATVAAWRDAAAIGLLLAVGLAVLGGSGSRPWLAPGVAVVLFCAGWSSQRILLRASAPPPLRGNVAVVDLSHVGLHSLEAWRDDALSGVYLNLMREGYFAIGAMEFDPEHIRAADVFITVAPTKPYTAGEIDVLEKYIHDGGTVLLSVGWEEMAGSEGLLDRFGVMIPHRPQGRATEPIPGTNILPNFWEAWPVLPALGGVGRDPGPYPLETLAALRGDPIIVRARAGRGQLVIIGDTKMLFCQNFETEDGAIMPNVQFFTWLVEKVFKSDKLQVTGYK